MEKELCSICGIGYIERDEKTGASWYSVFLEGFSFGCPEYAPSCKACADRQRKRYLDEMAETEDDWY